MFGGSIVFLGLVEAPVGFRHNNNRSAETLIRLVLFLFFPSSSDVGAVKREKLLGGARMEGVAELRE